MNFDDLPPEMLSEIMQRGIAEGKLPKPDGYNSEGKPVWRLATMAAWFGYSEQEAKEQLQDLGRERGINPFLDPKAVHRIQ